MRTTKLYSVVNFRNGKPHRTISGAQAVPLSVATKLADFVNARRKAPGDGTARVVYVCTMKVYGVGIQLPGRLVPAGC